RRNLIQSSRLILVPSRKRLTAHSTRRADAQAMDGIFRLLRKIVLYPEADADLPATGPVRAAVAALERFGFPRRLLALRLAFYALAWAVALTAAGVSLHTAWHSFDKPDRPDGNDGHTTIDF